MQHAEMSMQGRIAFRSVKASAMVSPRSAFARDKRGAEARVGPGEERRRSPELGSSPPPRAEAHGRGRHPLALRKKEELPCPSERASGQQTRRSSAKVCATLPALAAGTAPPVLSADDEPLASGERRGLSARPGCIIWRHPSDGEAGSLWRRARVLPGCARVKDPCAAGARKRMLLGGCLRACVRAGLWQSSGHCGGLGGTHAHAARTRGSRARDRRKEARRRPTRSMMTPTRALVSPRMKRRA